MAEKKVAEIVDTPVAPTVEHSSNGVTPENSEVCEFVGCIKHVVRTVSSGHVMYPFRVHYRTEKEILEHAVESTGRDVQKAARDGKPIKTNTDGSPRDIYEDLTDIKTFQERLDEYGALPADELERMQRVAEEQLAAVLKVLAAKKG